jgi:glycerol kinase
LNEMRRQFPLKGPVHVDGGMAANTWFCQFLADVTGSAISVLQQNEMTALGVARLVAQAAGTDISPGGQQARLYAPQQDLSACLVDFARARRLTQAWGKRHDDRV